MEGNGTGRNLEVLKIDGKKWKWNKPRNLKNRQELEIRHVPKKRNDHHRLDTYLEVN